MKQRYAKGQGIIEYAGALIIAAVLVATVLVTGPQGISTLFTDIIAAAADMINTNLEEV